MNKSHGPLKKLLTCLLLLSSGASLFAQGSYFQRLDRKHKKAFVTLGYGGGTSRWYSHMLNADLYDKQGNIIHYASEGALDFRAKNSSNLYDLEVSAPVGKIRLGIGICFEEFHLDKLVIKSNTPTDGTYILFDESFRFDKISGVIEVPFNPESDALFSISGKLRLGYYNYYNVSRFNFFGEAALAKTFIAGLGAVGDVKLFPHTYVYLFPYFEFKYFQNNRFEDPSNIRHKILTYSIIGGIRVDVSRE